MMKRRVEYAIRRLCGKGIESGDRVVTLGVFA